MYVRSTEHDSDTALTCSAARRRRFTLRTEADPIVATVRTPVAVSCGADDEPPVAFASKRAARTLERGYLCMYPVHCCAVLRPPAGPPREAHSQPPRSDKPSGSGAGM